MLNINGLDRIKAFGNSMYPLLHDNDVVYIKKIPFKNILVNDILVVKKGEIYITHRVIYKKDDYVVTKGDNTIKADPPVKKEDIIGKVHLVKRGKQLINPEDIYLIQSTHYFKEIQRLLQIFKKKNIEAVFLKGLPLHLYYENSHPRRLYIDCDLLVNQDNFDNLDKLMLKHKYKYENTHIAGRESTDNSQKSYVSTNSLFPVVFDLHLSPSFTIVHIDTKEIFYPRALLKEMTKEFLVKKRLVTVEGSVFPILSRHHLIVYLCLHFFHHNYKGIFRLEFLHNVINKDTYSDQVWVQCAEFITRYRLQNMVYPVFLMLRQYYATKIPSSFMVIIKPLEISSRYITRRYSEVHTLNEESRIESGINRFMLLFLLSPNPWWIKFTIFFNKDTVSNIVWVILLPLQNLYKGVYLLGKSFLKGRNKVDTKSL